jgi:hypothetical protein
VRPNRFVTSHTRFISLTNTTGHGSSIVGTHSAGSVGGVFVVLPIIDVVVGRKNLLDVNGMLVITLVMVVLRCGTGHRSLVALPAKHQAGGLLSVLRSITHPRAHDKHPPHKLSNAYMIKSVELQYAFRSLLQSGRPTSTQ